MSRLVRKPRAAGLEPQTSSQQTFGQQTSSLDNVFGSGTAATPVKAAVAGDTYLERLVKYIPAEIIGCSMVVNAILEQAAAGGSGATMAGFPVSVVAALALIAGVILTPVFCWYVREDGDAWVVNAVVSTLAFPFWAYLMGAVAFANVHDGNLAAILILTFTAVSGLVSPVAERPKQRQQKTLPKDGPRLVERLKAQHEAG